MNRTKFHWFEGMPSKCTILEAVPGVGNVGKLVVDALIEKHPSRVIGWILHPDFPPHATIGDDGLIMPPRIEVSSIMLPDGSTIIVMTGTMQPLTAAGQFEVSESILELASKSQTTRLLVLAGLSSKPEDRSIHVVCSDSAVRKSLEEDDIEVSKTQPEGGMIGITGMILSLAPILSVPAIGVVADTVGTSSDILAADRLSSWIEEAFDLPLELDLDTTEKTAASLMESINPGGTIEGYLEIDDPEVSQDFYV